MHTVPRPVLVVLGLLCTAWGACSSPPDRAATITADTSAVTAASQWQQWQQARAHYREGRCAEAEPLLERVVNDAQNNGAAWLMLGDCRFEMERYGAALAAYHRAHVRGATYLDGGYRYPAYHLAAAHAQRGTADSALVWLDRLLTEGRFPQRSALQHDTALAPLRSDPRFQALTRSGEDMPATDRVAGWQEDVHVLLAEVNRLNATYHDRPLPDSIQVAANRLRADIVDLTDGEIWVRMQMLLARLGQSHNSIWHWLGADRVDITMLPLTFYFFAGGVYIVGAEESRWVGANVLRIGETSASDAVRQIEPVVTRETPMKVKWLGPDYLRMPQVLYTLGITESAGSVPLTLRLQDGTTQTVAMQPVPVERREKLRAPATLDDEPSPLWLSHPDEYHWMQRLPDREILYVQLNQVLNENDGLSAIPMSGQQAESVDSFAARLRDTLQVARPSALVIDLRRNNGGNTFLYTDLLRVLIAYDMQPETQIAVLAGRNTASAAVNLAVDLDRLTDALFVGEPTGGKPNTHGDESPVVLPYSGLHAGLSAVFWQHSHPRDARLGIAPDVPVALTSEAYFAGHDPVLDATRRVLRSSPHESMSLLDGIACCLLVGQLLGDSGG